MVILRRRCVFGIYKKLLFWPPETKLIFSSYSFAFKDNVFLQTNIKSSDSRLYKICYILNIIATRYDSKLYILPYREISFLISVLGSPVMLREFSSSLEAAPFFKVSSDTLSLSGTLNTSF